MATPPTSQDEPRHQSVIASHLAPGYGTGFDGLAPAASDTLSLPTATNPSQTAQGSSSAPDLLARQPTPPTEESSLLLHGGDIHRDLYKINARTANAPGFHQRSKTISYLPTTNGGGDDDDDGIMAAEDMLQPQGFRRQFIRQKLEERGRFSGENLPFTKSFVEFLDLYGSFAGEDLSDSDNDDEAIEEEDDDEEAPPTRPRGRPMETRPLLGRRKSSRFAARGDAGMLKSFFTTLKAFIGTGIMFLPKAFNNGGILFSSLTLIFVAGITMWAFHLLLMCRAKYPGGYGDIGREIAGSKMRALILGSITLSQLGFVCTGLVFVADNWLSFLRAIFDGVDVLSSRFLIIIQAVVIIPLAFIRDISKLGPAALVADVFIVIGVGYIWYYDIFTLSTRGIHPSVQLFNPRAYTLTIGASIFTFEGIGLILPIQSSMRHPEKFEPLLGTVMLIITCIFTGVGALCYATFGSDTQIEVINNFPQDSPFVNAVQFMYALAVLVGNPVQLFPAVRILESKIFGHRSGREASIKWKKNGFRTIMVIICLAVAIGGAENLDRFVALIGSFACVPLVYIYPPYLHYKAVASGRLIKSLDIGLMVLGLVGMVYTTIVTIATSFLYTSGG